MVKVQGGTVAGYRAHPRSFGRRRKPVFALAPLSGGRGVGLGRTTGGHGRMMFQPTRSVLLSGSSDSRYFRHGQWSNRGGGELGAIPPEYGNGMGQVLQ